MPELRKPFLCAAIGFQIFLFPFTTTAQHWKTELQFGVGIFKPRVQNGVKIQSKITHNFWLGINTRKMLSSGIFFHAGLCVNGYNYRLSAVDSPQTTFITLTCISTPLQLEYTLLKNLGLFLGTEPKFYSSGHLHTATPLSKISSRIRFPGKEGFQPVGLGMRLGLVHHIGDLQYFLQASADVTPFRNTGGVQLFDRKIIFGFTWFPLFPVEKKPKPGL